MKNNKIIKKAIEFYGEQHQIIKAIEEMGELTQSLSKYLNCKTIGNVHEEMADVLIMLAQLQNIFGDVSIEIKRKLERLKHRMDGENE